MRSIFAISAMLSVAGAAAAQEPLPQPPQPQPQIVRRTSAPPVEVAGSCAAVPMQLIHDMPVVEVRIGGQGPFLFGIDTGAGGHGRITRALAERLGLQAVGEAHTAAPGGTTEVRPIYGAGPIAVGGITFTGAGLLALSALPGAPGGLDGIIGIDMLKELTLTLDYAHGVAMLSRTPVTGGVAATFDDGTPWIAVEIAGHSYNVRLDTGNGASGLFLEEAAARALPLAGAPIERGRARTSFGEFVIMEAPLGAPVTIGGVRLPQATTVGWPPARGSGNLGSRALAGATLRLDRIHNRVEIATPAAPPACAG